MHDNWNYRACRPAPSRAICRPDWTELATKSPGLYPRSRTFRGVRCSRRGWLENPVYLPVAESYTLGIPARGLSRMTLYGYGRVSVREPEGKNLDLQGER